MMPRVLLIVSLCALAACQSVQTTQPGSVGVDRKQSMMVSSEDVNASAAKAYQQLMAGAKQKGLVNQNAAQTERVRRIAQRLIPKTGAFRPDAPGWAWETNVISSKEVNAWCMPGGKIAVYSGLIERLQATDDELAAVIGDALWVTSQGYSLQHRDHKSQPDRAAGESADGLFTHPPPKEHVN